MLFSTPFFLFVFLPVFFSVYWMLPRRAPFLLLGSLVFYGWSEPVFLWVVLASACCDWIFGKLIYKGTSFRRFWLVAGIVTNLSLLVYAKYTVFAIQNLNVLLDKGGWSVLPVPVIALPLGVSFIVFEKITYLVDLYRRISKPSHSLLNYLNYIFLFPKLLAGPIVKYHDIELQLSHPTHCYEDIREGLIRFLTGLGKKVLLADLMSPTADKVFSLPASALDPASAWLGLACFSLQIYFDFSGYSDMAIGMGRILGFRLLENFRTPYLATSFTDFWKRWHISLSSWIREYLYIPLGGNRVSPARVYLNLCICFLLSGLWHGASWNFVIWGCFHGLILVADRAFWLQWQQRLPLLANIGITFFLVAISWVFFRCDTFSHALHFVAALFGAPASTANAVFLQRDTLVALVAGSTVVLLPLIQEKIHNPRVRIPKVAVLASLLVLLVLCSGRLTVSSFAPFLYFRF